MPELPINPLFNNQKVYKKMGNVIKFDFKKPSPTGLVFNVDARNPACYSGTGMQVFDTITRLEGTMVGDVSYDNETKAFDFYSSNNNVSKIVFNSNLLLQPEVATFVCVFKTGSSMLSRMDIFNEWVASYVCYFLFFMSGSDMYFYMNINGNSLQYVLLPDFFITNTWYNVTCTYDGSVARIYVNGVLKSTANISGILKNNGEPVQLGAGNSMENEGNFNGKIAIMQIYDRSFNSTEVENLYNQLNS